MTDADGQPSLWFNPAMGVAGDMVLAALLAVGADESFVRSQLDAVPLTGWTLTISPATRSGLVATVAEVRVTDDHDHRSWSHIDQMLTGASLHPTVAAGARRTFAGLARVEAVVHGIDVDEVHFHEVGAADAIVDIVGSWSALVSVLDSAGSSADDACSGLVHSGPVGLGAGTVTMAHGRVPLPAPATLGLLEGLPVVALDTGAESATPTGVALLSAMVSTWGPVPDGRVLHSGRGAGRNDPASHANVLTAVVLEPERPERAQPITAAIIETNVDDVTPEVLGHLVDLLLAAGADDAWLTPITMKKSRPAQVVSVLCRPDLAESIRHVLAIETGTLGIRERRLDKFELDRHVDRVVVDGHEIRMKVGPHGAKPEHVDVAAAAASTSRPLRDIAAAAQLAWSATSGLSD